MVPRPSISTLLHSQSHLFKDKSDLAQIGADVHRWCTNLFSGWPKAFCDLPSSLSNLISIYFLPWILAILDFHEFFKSLGLSLVLGLLTCFYNIIPFSTISFQLTLTHPTSYRRKTFKRPSIPLGLVRRSWHISVVPSAFSVMKAMTLVIICLNVCYFHESRNYVYHVHCSEHNASHLDNQ